MQRSNKVKSGLLLGFACCFFSFGLAYWYTDGFEAFFSPPPVVQIQKPRIPVAAKPVVKKEEFVAIAPVVKSDAKSDAGSLQNFTVKHAKLEEMKLDVAIAEQQAKLVELTEGKKANTPAVAMPSLPAFELPVMQPSVPTQVLPEVPAMPSRRQALVAIQGMDGQLSAVVNTGEGRKTLKEGDSYLGSRIQKINLDGLTLKSGKVIVLGE